MKTSLFAILALLPTTAIAQSIPAVYPGCTAPPSTFAHTWYFDPVNGKTAAQWTAAGIPLSSQGTAITPWHDIQAIFSQPNTSITPGYPFPLLSTAPYTHAITFPQIPPVNPVPWAYADLPGPTGPSPNNPTLISINPNSPISPGDAIILMSGNYGSLNIAAPGTVINNPSFLTFMAGPNQTPVINSLQIADTNNLRFSGIKFQNIVSSYMSGLAIGIGDAGGGEGYYYTGPLQTHDIIFDNNDISNADRSTAATWAQIDWYNQTSQLMSVQGSAQAANTFCISITNNHFHDGHFLLANVAQKSLIANNEFDHFADDAINPGGSNVTITHNFIHDAVDLSQPAPNCPASGPCTPGTGPVLVYAHVDDIQWYSVPHPGITWLQYNNGIVDSNTVIDMYDPTNKFPTPSNGFNDYSGDNNLQFLNMQYTNNVLVTGGLIGILADSADTTSIIAGNTVISDGTNIARAANPPGISTGYGFRICNNIAPTISWNGQHGTTADHNLSLGQLVYWLQNPDGTYAANGSFFNGGNGFYGPTGFSPTDDANHTNEIILTPGTAQSSLFQSLVFGPNGVIIPNTIPNLTLKPGPASIVGTTSSCSTPLNVTGNARSIPPGAY
jgi:hypothetical protein